MAFIQLNLTQIRLRIAGIFYDQTFSFTDLGAAPTIGSLMEFARTSTALDYGFEFRAAAKNLPGMKAFRSMIKIGTRISAPFTSLGGSDRPAGLYELLETPIPGGVVAWQYYVIDINGNSRSSNPPGSIVSPPVAAPASKFTPYDQMAVLPGDTVIWRMVAIRITPEP